MLLMYYAVPDWLRIENDEHEFGMGQKDCGGFFNGWICGGVENTEGMMLIDSFPIRPGGNDLLGVGGSYDRPKSKSTVEHSYWRQNYPKRVGWP